ncbi:bifunctional cytochrome P450/NADPH--P450 reductase [Pontibacillus yanchengensis]|uniref:Bifunctional cytochrome P450/NADPH--P450 reductase n=1 Tax=Pontibacillus yanchengensis Y32 TaxID=1385514 RepID=A0A0A2TAG9_9BACI|nr:bifunctional cytochrome P450/NADPH--P450 reductase [Pontibacillus yanchengensis]KGP72812.1 NADPH--cytochrome P450 reductase [Pontibacillus yanchengensis Y32]
MTNTRSVPSPKAYGPLRNLPLINRNKPIQSLMKLARQYGPIFDFEFPGRHVTYVSSHELVKELSDERRFDKKVHTPLRKVRAFSGDGLFTSETSEPNWKKAHNILLPSFSQQAMKGYHDKMADLAVQLVQKWARLNPNESIEVPEDMTRLTLDTIGLCGFNYRFNSFYREQPHPFIQSMVRAMDEAMSQTQRFGIQDRVMVRSKRQFQEDIQDMFSLVDQLIAERKANGDQGEDDLLSHMLKGKDPETGEALDDENIRYQIITFLIAGHETTSGMLSFALHFLMKNPDKLQKAYQEVDEVAGDGVPTYKQVKKLKYVRNILNESLRLWPTAPAFGLSAKEDTTIGDGIPFSKGETATVLIPELHRDKSVWGEDVEEFKPERFEDPEAIPHHAFKPFGNGQRACIGQQFAMHEATLVLGMLLQNFEFVDHTNYELKIKETLTLKPDGLTMQVKPRKNQMAFAMTSSQEEKSAEESNSKQSQNIPKHGTPLLLLHGSNLGTAKGIAKELAETGEAQGFSTTVASLDEYAGNLPIEGGVLIVSASYNGNPPDNAHAFIDWLEQAGQNELQGVRFAVFGCGDRNWANTYQRIPSFIDEKMAEKGATRLSERGEGDASDDFEGQYEQWDEQLWPNIADVLDIQLNTEQDATSNALSMEFVSGVTATPLAKTHQAFTAKLLKNEELQSDVSERSTRHIEVRLPNGVTYQEGDHLGVIPQNRQELVNRVLNRFGMEANTLVSMHGGSGRASHLPLEQPVSVENLLVHYVEMQEPVTRAQLRELAAYTTCPPHKVELEQLLEEEAYKEEVLQKRITMIDLLEQYVACELPFERFIALLPPLKARYYSISSSPSVQAQSPSITVSVVREKAWSGNGEYKGVASNYLANVQEGEDIACFISTPQSNFQLPEDSQTPMILVGPGTGLAPLRGFLQARQSLKQNGYALGEAHLYYGCRHPEHDYLYKDELTHYEQEGIVHVHTAFSRIENQPKTYVQHLIEKDGTELIQMLDNGARLYVCGDGSEMAPAVEDTLLTCYMDYHHVTKQAAMKWLDQLQTDGVYAKDVWAG